MDDLDLSNLLDLTSKDDRMQVFFVIIVFLFRWPHTTTFFTLLCLAQIHFGFVPQDHHYLKILAIQAAVTWISTQLGTLSESLVGYCRRNASDAGIYTFKLLFVRPVSFAKRAAIYVFIISYWNIFHIGRSVTRATSRFVKSLARALAAFNGDIAIPDDEVDHDSLGDFHYESMSEAESDTDTDFELEDDFELEYDSDISNDELQDLKNRSKDTANEDAEENEDTEANDETEANEDAEENEETEANEDTSTLTSTLAADTTMTPNGLDERSSRIRSGSQSSNVRRIEDYYKKSIEESDSNVRRIADYCSEESDAHCHSE